MAHKKVTLTKDPRAIRQKPWLVRWSGDYDPATDKCKKYCKSFSRKVDAEKFLAEKEREFQDGMPRDQYNITIGEFLDKFLTIRRNSLAKSTIDDYEDTIPRLNDYFGSHAFLKNIRTEDAEQFIAQLEIVHPDHMRTYKPLADSSRNKYLKYSKRIFKTAQEWGYIRKSPFTEIKARKPRKKGWYFISPVEFQSIINKTPSLRLKALYSVMYGCGLRYGEAINLLWSGQNIDFENNRINIINRPGTTDIPSFNIKDYEHRSIPMPKWVVDILTNLQGEADENCPFVFMTIKRWAIVKNKWHSLKQENWDEKWDSEMLMNNVLRDFKTHCRQAGIKTTDKLTIHCLRKSYACNLANSNTPVQTLMKLMGHGSIQTTMEYYLQSSDANEQAAVEKLDRMMEKVG